MPRRNYFVILCAVLVGALCYAAADRNPLARSFSEITDLVERRYVDKVDREKLWAGAVRGMLNELSDPYSEYIDPKEAAELQSQLNQEFAGIGIQVALDPASNKLTIISPIVGTPAYRAGVLAGDVIAKIDGHSTHEMTYIEATNRIHGKEGDPVQLTLERPGQTEPIEMPPIKREMINVDSVLGDTRGSNDQWNFLLQSHPKIGYVRIISFGEHTVAELKAALAKLEQEHVQGLVLDLRNDPGGLLTAAIEVCNMFLPEGKPIVSTRGREGKEEQKHFAEGGAKFPNVPMVVLVNHGSASASEIVAACLQDNGRAVVAGERSYGKGTVQNVISLDNGLGILKLTTAQYIRPSGHNIRRLPDAKETDEWGVTPDEHLGLKASDEEVRKWMLWRRDRDVVRPHAEKDSGKEASKEPQKVAGDDDAKSSGEGNKSVDDAGIDWSQHDATLKRAVEYLKGKIE